MNIRIASEYEMIAKFCSDPKFSKEISKDPYLVKIVPEVKQQNYKGFLCINLVVVLSNSVRDSYKGKCSAMLFFLERIVFEQNRIRRKLQYDFRHYRHCEPSVTRKLA